MWYIFDRIENNSVPPVPFQNMDLFSDLGGQAGLWLGMSIIAFFELLELVADLIMISCARCRARREAEREMREEKRRHRQARAQSLPANHVRVSARPSHLATVAADR